MSETVDEPKQPTIVTAWKAFLRTRDKNRGWIVAGIMLIDQELPGRKGLVRSALIDFYGKGGGINKTVQAKNFSDAREKIKRALPKVYRGKVHFQVVKIEHRPKKSDEAGDE